MNKIQPNKFYNLTELLELVPWVNSIVIMAKWVDADMAGENILKAIKVGKGTGTRYHIKGENIIKFLVEFEAGRFDPDYPREEVNKMEDETNVEEGNTAVEEAQAEETANGVDETEENEGVESTEDEA